MPADLDLLIEQIKAEINIAEAKFPGGYPNDIELALLDAVLSIRARYGNSPSTGVGRRVALYRGARSTDRCDDLDALATFPPSELRAICGGQKTAGLLKSDVVQAAAASLSAAGVRSAADLNASDAQRRAYLSVRGVGPITWRYLLMLTGHPNVKPDVMIQRYVNRALGRSIGDDDSTAQLVIDAAESLKVDSSALDHAIWLFERSRRKEAKA